MWVNSRGEQGQSTILYLCQGETVMEENGLRGAQVKAAQSKRIWKCNTVRKEGAQPAGTRTWVCLEAITKTSDKQKRYAAWSSLLWDKFPRRTGNDHLTQASILSSGSPPWLHITITWRTLKNPDASHLSRPIKSESWPQSGAKHQYFLKQIQG